MAHDNHHVPLSTFQNVFYALLGLTALTVITAKFMDFGAFNVLVAFSIAAVKGFLVLAYFMHLKYDAPKNRYIIGSSFFFVFLLFVICILDIYTRVPVDSTL